MISHTIKIGLISGLVAFPIVARGGLVEPTNVKNDETVEPRYAQVDPARDGFGYPFGSLRYHYPFEHSDLPDLSVLDQVVVLLSPTEDGWVGPVDGADVVGVQLDQLISAHGDNDSVILYGSALAVINQGVRDHLESAYGLIGHLVTPDASEILYRTTREDIREDDDTEITLFVWRAVVGEIRTVAQGERIGERIDKDDPEGNVNHSAHARLRERLQLQEGYLLTRKEIDEEVHRLNRHPGRRADVAIAPTSEPGEVLVDYMLTESKPWNAYAQISNTGSKSTDEWQERFGFIHRQLTGRDDVLELDFVTTNFDETNAVLGSYTFDFGPRTRMKLFGRWNEYTAKDVGFGFENFLGDGYAIGAEAAINIWQDGPKFVDAIIGARYEHIHVENLLFNIEGEDDFFLPYVGVRYLKRTPVHSAYGEVTIESNWGSVAGSSKEDVQALGRFGADDDFTRMRAQLSHSFYLEPILTPGKFKGDQGPDGMTLAHEVALKLRGQYSFNSRLVPNFEFVSGGFHSVRGYPESASVGDDGVMGSVEYRFHLGRSLPMSQETGTLFGQPFRTARARPYGGADWDVIFKGFLDVGHVSSNDAPFFENAETLVGAGVGIETRLKQNVTLRLDYGMAFTNIGEGANQTTNVGDSRLHFSAQIVF